MLKFKYCRRLLLDIINPQKVETREVQMTGRSLHENKGTIGDHYSKRIPFSLNRVPIEC